MQLALRRHVWFWLGVPDKASEQGFPCYPDGLEAINRNDSWAGGPRLPPASDAESPSLQSPAAGSLGPELWVSGVSEEAARIAKALNT